MQAAARRGLPALPAWRWAVVRTIYPHPIFRSLAQPFPNRIHENVTRFLFEFVMISQAVIEKIALPTDAELSRHEFFPVPHSRLHSRFAREGNDRMQMIRHQQAQAAVPDESLVVELHGGEHSVAGIGSAQLILAARDTVDGDEEPTGLGHPLRNCVGQFSADGQIHARSVAKTLACGQTQKR